MRKIFSRAPLVALVQHLKRFGLVGLTLSVCAFAGPDDLIKKDLTPACDATEIKLKNCWIRFETFQLHLTKNKILMNDGTWRSVFELPLKGETTDWYQARMHKIHDRVLLELYIWGPPEGEVEIQKLNWFVYELSERTLALRLERGIQKRTRFLASENKDFVDGSKEAFGLKPGKHKKVIWWGDRDRGEF